MSSGTDIRADARRRELVVGIDASRAGALRRTGVEQYAYHVIQELKRIVPPSVRVVLYSRDPLRGPLGDLPPGWESCVLGWPPRYLWTQGRLSWEMLRRPPDLLWVPAHVAPLALPRRTVVTMHDVAFMPHPEAYTWRSNLYLRFDGAMMARCARRILTVSEFSRREIVRYFHADPDKIAVTPLGFDAAAYRRVPAVEAAATARRFGLDARYFLFVGRLERKKNLAGLLAAFRTYKDLHPGDGHMLVLVGKHGAGYAQEMRAGASRGLGGTNDVRELGFVPDEDMAALYSGATALVFPSLYEGFGLPVLEAFACGTPVIASDCASLPEVAGDAALLVNPSDSAGIAAAMARLVDDAALRARLVAAGSARLGAFSWERCARGTWRAIEAALAE